MALHSSTLVWKIPWTEEPGRLQTMGSLRVGYDWATSLFTFMHWRRKWQTHSSVLAWRILGTVEPGGLPSMGSHRVRHDWSDLAAAAAFSPKLPSIQAAIKHWAEFPVLYSRTNQSLLREFKLEFNLKRGRSTAQRVGWPATHMSSLWVALLWVIVVDSSFRTFQELSTAHLFLKRAFHDVFVF